MYVKKREERAKYLWVALVHRFSQKQLLTYTVVFAFINVVQYLTRKISAKRNAKNFYNIKYYQYIKLRSINPVTSEIIYRGILLEIILNCYFPVTTS